MHVSLCILHALGVGGGGGGGEGGREGGREGEGGRDIARLLYDLCMYNYMHVVICS